MFNLEPQKGEGAHGNHPMVSLPLYLWFEPFIILSLQEQKHQQSHIHSLKPVQLKGPLSSCPAASLHQPKSSEQKEKIHGRSSESSGAENIPSVKEPLLQCLTVKPQTQILVFSTWETRRETVLYRSQTFSWKMQKRIASGWKLKILLDISPTKQE